MALFIPRGKILWMVNLVLGLLLVLEVLFLAREILSLSLAKEKEARGPERRSTAKRSFQDYEILLKNNPFGAMGGELKVLSPSSGGMGPSAREAELIGTVAGPVSRSYAILSDGKGEQEIFAIGDWVFGMGTLERIERDRVFLREEGKTIEIPLVEMISLKDLGRPTQGGASGSDLVQRVGEGSFILDQKVIATAVENPGQILTEARLLPHMSEEGNTQGFLLSEVKSGGIYERLGLQDGDVLLRVNENEISTPESALQAFTALKGMDRVQLDILRDGANLTMTYQIR